ncbi:hypothetical protein K438DRAFT_1749436 [Mycena galopus ATCC 62051]|nr:hypothetical protein K438DRAFT_1749436 [Mycena galopus ATCC 62051]
MTCLGRHSNRIPSGSTLLYSYTRAQGSGECAEWSEERWRLVQTRTWIEFQIPPTRRQRRGCCIQLKDNEHARGAEARSANRQSLGQYGRTVPSITPFAGNFVCELLPVHEGVFPVSSGWATSPCSTTPSPLKPQDLSQPSAKVNTLATRVGTVSSKHVSLEQPRLVERSHPDPRQRGGPVISTKSMVVMMNFSMLTCRTKAPIPPPCERWSLTRRNSALVEECIRKKEVHARFPALLVAPSRSAACYINHSLTITSLHLAQQPTTAQPFLTGCSSNAVHHSSRRSPAIVIKPGSHVFRRRLPFSTYKQAAFFGLDFDTCCCLRLGFTYFLGIKPDLLGIPSARNLTRNFSRRSIAWINFIPSHCPEAGIHLAGRSAFLRTLVMFWLANYQFALKFRYVWVKLSGFLCNGDDGSFLLLGGKTSA